MKKYIVLCGVMCVTLAFSGCKSSESAYRQAYEKAQAEDETSTDVVEETTVVAPVVTAPAGETTVVDNIDNVSVRQENVTVVDGEGLKNFSVVVGSFSVKANAEGLQQTLKNAGYNAQLAYNAERDMYRVVAASFDEKVDAVHSRNELRSQYQDAWLLYSAQ